MTAPDHLRGQRHAHRCKWCGGPAVIEGSTPARIYDVLDSDPAEWLTIDELVDRTNRSRSSVGRGAYRLVEAGLARKRRYRRAGAPAAVTEFAGPLRKNPAMRDRSWPPSVEFGVLCSCGDFLPNPHRHPLKYILDAHKAKHRNPGVNR